MVEHCNYSVLSTEAYSSTMEGFVFVSERNTLFTTNKGGTDKSLANTKGTR